MIMIKGMPQVRADTIQQDKRVLMHPLINKASKHYDSESKTAIEMMEEQFTVNEMIAFCKVNIFKYEYRKNYKGQLDSDLGKIETYKNYLNLLLSCKHIYSPTVKETYARNGITVEYK